jgi:hypothetical protein
MVVDQPNFLIKTEERSMNFKPLEKLMGKEFIAHLENDPDLGNIVGFWPRNPFVVRRVLVETWKRKTFENLQIVNRFYILDKFTKQWVFMDEVIYKETAVDPKTGKIQRCGGTRVGYSPRVRAPQLSLVGLIDLKPPELA